ncbi:hypothetical protein B0T17DRAFT_618894 [Bombardia bombarda]|uniref:Uncharacterized protein n=1 Tax=Bombardia bombarda TaxID=252184 RepID=A0AA39WMS3_9PEZI|nr:hypothetical protein B0T17DRAFT_618894 [Bombardia bombarda]
MEGTSGRVGDTLHRTNMDRTLRELRRVKEETEDALNHLRASASQSRVTHASLSDLDTLEILTKAHRDVAESEPFLPLPGSVLPALLALRKTHETIVQSNEHMGSQAASLEQVNRRLEVLRADMKEQLALQAALEKRVQSLRKGLENRMETTPEQRAKERIAELKKKKSQYDMDTSRLLKLLNSFIDDQLAPMLAAEELGGPVVGDMMEIDSEELSAGFSAKGKLKKGNAQPDEDKRQRRIDDIWGPAQGQQDQPGKRKRDQGDEASAAGAEMRNLTEQLLNQLMEADGDSSAAYVKIPRESASARFLVRSKVAVFHPRDATLLRLVDFGREFDE